MPEPFRTIRVNHINIVHEDFDAPVTGLRLDTNGSYLFEGSWDYMGFDVRDDGLFLILDKDVPGAVERQIAPVMTGFLEQKQVEKDSIDFYCIHPGGQKLLDSLRTWWVYGLVLISFLFVWSKHETFLERRAYERERNELGEHLARERLDPYETLAKMQGDDALDTLGNYMKLDTRLGSLTGI